MAQLQPFQNRQQAAPEDASQVAEHVIAQALGEQPDSDFGFTYNDDGEMVFTFGEQQAAPTVSNTELTAAAAAVVDAAVPPVTAALNGDARIVALEGTVARLTEALTQVVQRMQGQQPQIQQPEPEEDFDISDSASFKRMIETTVAKAMQTHMAPMQDTMRQAQLRFQYVDAAEKHGPEFVTLFPATKALLMANPSLGFDGAFELVKTIRGVATAPVSSTTTTPADSNQSRTVLSAQQVRERTSALPALSGRANSAPVSGNGKQSNMSLEAAAEAAIAELSGVM